MGKGFGRKEIEITADGSATVYLPELDEHYHSIKGASAESMHVYVECGFRHCSKSSIRILEVGFGTGLNAVLTAMNTDGKTVEYFSLELYPLDLGIIENMGYGKVLPANGNELFHRIHAAEWGTIVPITSEFSLQKIKCDLTDAEVALPNGIDVVYFDAFAPEKQPEMWSDDVFQRIYRSMNDGGVLTTYCAKGEIRRRLQSVGFTVERLPGPPAGKREILRASKNIRTPTERNSFRLVVP